MWDPEKAMQLTSHTMSSRPQASPGRMFNLLKYTVYISVFFHVRKNNSYPLYEIIITQQGKRKGISGNEICSIETEIT